MTEKLNSGLNAIVETIVMDKDSAINYASGEVNVYATPAMIGLMENAAKTAVEHHLPSGCTTVGTLVNVKHISATPIGIKVKATAELIEVDGKRLVFRVEAHDSMGKIGEGIHERFVINVEKFMNKLNSSKL